MSPHCHTCGAPVNTLVSTGRLACDYCGTVHNLRPETRSNDRVSWINEDADHACPNCRIPLSRALVDSEKVEACRQCLGILMVREGFSTVIESRRVRFRGTEEAPVLYDPRALEHSLDCPACGKRMETHPYYGPGNVVIDSCHACALIWVDTGELTQIEKAPGRRGWEPETDETPVSHSFDSGAGLSRPAASGLGGELLSALVRSIFPHM